MRRRAALKIALWLPLPVGAWAFGCAAAPDRRLLPGFDPRQLRGRRVLLAPYALGAAEDRSLPIRTSELPPRDGGSAARHGSALDYFYEAGAANARKELREANAGFELLDLPPSRWWQFFAGEGDFVRVGVGADRRYAVPTFEHLRALGLSPEYVVVVDRLRFRRHTLVDGVLRSRYLLCEADFLAWDYLQKRTIVEGTSLASVGVGDSVTAEQWSDLGRRLAHEIMVMPPFIGDT